MQLFVKPQMFFREFSDLRIRKFLMQYLYLQGGLIAIVFIPRVFVLYNIYYSTVMNEILVLLYKQVNFKEGNFVDFCP